MANAFLKPEVISATALGLLERELVLSNLVWTSHGFNFEGAKNDTVTVPIPARTTAREFPWRSDRSVDTIVLDELTEDSLTVKLDRDIYNAIKVTDEEMTLDIRDFGAQVLDPQVRSVATFLDDQVASMIEAAPYTAPIDLTEADPWVGAVKARSALNANNVAREGRTLLVGADVEEAFILSGRLSDVSQSGSDGALREATIGRVAGFNVVGSSAIDARSAYAFVPSAFALATRAPVIPAGVTFGSSASHAGYSMRWIRDYDPTKLRDRSIVNTYAGFNVMLDQPTPGDTVGAKTLQRAVKLNLDVVAEPV